MGHLARSADALIVVLWGAVAAYFVRRFALQRRLVSLALAAMATGWLYIGLEDELPARLTVVPAKAAAVALGLVLWYSIWRVEREDRR